ncbi:MAG: 4-hydroxythreonine-4-phosphate dehydrogenase PdxA [Planctomycetota bacterium]
MAARNPDLSRERQPVLAVSCGDPAGVGPEVIASALLRVCQQGADASRFILLGDPRVFAAVGLDEQGGFRFQAAGSWDPKADPAGGPSPRSGAAAVAALEAAIDLALTGAADGVVTGPLSKEAMRAAGHPWPGQTELLIERCKAGEALMLFVADRLRVALLTRHVPIREVPGLIDQESIERTLLLLTQSLERDFGVVSPTIGVAALNPHAGEHGLFGSEERDCIAPAVLRSNQRGLRVLGPMPADTLFVRQKSGEFDAVLALYHDQGLIPLKLMGFGRAVNVTAGLPIVRTSPDHGTAYDIVGKGIADPSSMAAAIDVATLMIRNRRSFLNPNPRTC